MPYRQTICDISPRQIRQNGRGRLKGIWGNCLYLDQVRLLCSPEEVIADTDSRIEE